MRTFTLVLLSLGLGAAATLTGAGEAPTFARDLNSRDLWSKPAVARFHFKLVGGKQVEVSEPAVN